MAAPLRLAKAKAEKESEEKKKAQETSYRCAFLVSYASRAYAQLMHESGSPNSVGDPETPQATSAVRPALLKLKSKSLSAPAHCQSWLKFIEHVGSF